MEEAEEIFRLSFVARDDLPKVEEPSEKALDLPPAAVTTQGTTILGLVFARRIVRRDELNAPLTKKTFVESIAVVRLVADQSRRELSEEARVECLFNERDFMALTTRNPDGERKARAVCHCHDLGRFAAASFPNKRTPFFAPA